MSFHIKTDAGAFGSTLRIRHVNWVQCAP